MKCKCKKCSYEWESIKDNPKCCPRCNSYSWNKPRVREKKKTVWNGEK